MKLSPLQLDGYYVRQLEFGLRKRIENQLTLTWLPGLAHTVANIGSIDALTIKVDTSGGVKHDDPSRFRFELKIESNNPEESNYPFEFRICVIGFFRVSLENAPQNIGDIVNVNAPSILFSAAREILCSATGRSLFPGVMLPAVSFVDSIAPPVTADERPGGKKKKRVRRKKNAP